MSRSTYTTGLESVRVRRLRMRIDVDSGLKRLKLRGKELGRLPHEVFSLVELQVLDLSPERESCLFYHLVDVPEDIGKLRNLCTLMLDTNEIEELPPQIGLLSALERLSLSNNKFLTLPENFGDLQNLTSLHMANNEFIVFPSCLCRLTNLEFLDMCDNYMIILPPEINQLTKLESLHLYLNNFETLPDELCDLVGLRSLWLGKNNLKSLPRRFGELQELDWGQGHTVSLSVDDNPLTVPPLEVCKKGVAYIEVYFAKKGIQAPTTSKS